MFVVVQSGYYLSMSSRGILCSDCEPSTGLKISSGLESSLATSSKEALGSYEKCHTFILVLNVHLRIIGNIVNGRQRGEQLNYIEYTNTSNVAMSIQKNTNKILCKIVSPFFKSTSSDWPIYSEIVTEMT